MTPEIARCSPLFASDVPRNPVRNHGVLKERLDQLVATFDVSTIEPDPLQLVLRYSDPLDQEVAGFLAAAFAYGRAETIVANIGVVLARTQLPSSDPTRCRLRES